MEEPTLNYNDFIKMPRPILEKVSIALSRKRDSGVEFSPMEIQMDAFLERMFHENHVRYLGQCLKL